MLQKHQQSQHVGSRRLVTCPAVRLPRGGIPRPPLHRRDRCGGQRIGRQALIQKAALQRPMGANRSCPSASRTSKSTMAGLSKRRARDTAWARRASELLVFLQRFLGQHQVPVGQRCGIHRLGLLVLMRLVQVFAIQGAINGHLALGAATEGADIAPHAGAEAPRTAGLTNGTSHFLSIKVRGASDG